MFSPDGTLISASAAPHCGATTTKQTNKQTKNRVEYRELSSSRSNTSFTDGQQQGWWSWDLATVTMTDRGLKLSPRPSTVGNCIVWYCNVYLSLVNLEKTNKKKTSTGKQMLVAGTVSSKPFSPLHVTTCPHTTIPA